MPENKAVGDRKDKEQMGKDQKSGFAAAVSERACGRQERHSGHATERECNTPRTLQLRKFMLSDGVDTRDPDRV